LRIAPETEIKEKSETKEKTPRKQLRTLPAPAK